MVKLKAYNIGHSMSSRTDKRAKLRALFNFDDIIDRPFWLVIADLLQIAIVLASFAYIAFNERVGRPEVTGFNFLEGVLAACIMLVVSSLFLFSLQVLYKLLAGWYRHRKRAVLEAASREIIREDYKRALKSLLAAAQISPGDLTEIQRNYSSGFEQLLFTGSELDEFLGPLKTQTLRSLTPVDNLSEYAPLTRNRFRPDAYFDGLFTPLHVCCVFFTKENLIIGEAVIDALTGKITKRLRRVTRKQVRSAEFTNFLSAANLPEPVVNSWLHNRRLDRKELIQVRRRLKRSADMLVKTLNRRQYTPDAPYLIRQEKTGLDVTLRSGKTVSLPMEVKQTIVQSDAGFVQSSKKPNVSVLPTEDLKRDAVLSAFLGNEGFSEDAEEAHMRMNAPSVPTTRALWSTGRQQYHREFIAVWPLIRVLAASLVISGSVLFLMNALTTDTSKWSASTEEADLNLSTPEGDRPRIEPERKLSDGLSAVLEDTSGAEFACTIGTMRIYGSPSRNTETLALVTGSHPLIALPAETGEEVPEGWKRIITRADGKDLTGYARSRDFSLRGPKARTVCFP